MGLMDIWRRLFGGSPRPGSAPPPTAAELIAPRPDGTAPVPQLRGGPAITLPADECWGTDEPRLRSFGLPVARTAQQLAGCMERTQRELFWLADPTRRVAAKGGHYQPIVRRKRNGRIRIVLAPRQHLKSVQRWILRNILDRVQTHPAAHGFRRGRSIRSHARTHLRKTVLVQCDLENWFHQFTYAQVWSLFRRLGYGRTVARLLAQLCTAPIREMTPAICAATGLTEAEVVAATRQTVRDSRHPMLPQGAPTSPSLANLLSISLDEQLAALAGFYGAAYSRYADDCAFSGGGTLPRQTAAFIGQLLTVIRRNGHAASPGKLWVRRPGAQQLVTGLIVNDGPSVPRAQRRALRAMLHNCARHGPASQNRDGHPHFAAHLLGRIAHVAAANPAHGAALRAAFRRIAW